ncbi:hypothetical protein [Methylobacterium sp. Leaf89]|nr:hypothetical protein [Methylobacterium sp. Leaf89]
MSGFDGYLAGPGSERAGTETLPDERVLALRAHLRAVLRSLMSAIQPAC